MVMVIVIGPYHFQTWKRHHAKCCRTWGAATAWSRAALLTKTTNNSPKTSTLTWRLRPVIFLPPS